MRDIQVLINQIAIYCYLLGDTCGVVYICKEIARGSIKERGENTTARIRWGCDINQLPMRNSNLVIARLSLGEGAEAEFLSVWPHVGNCGYYVYYLIRTGD